MLQRTLAGWRARAVLVSDGAAAAEEFERAQENDEAYQLVILDDQMPGLDGFAVAEHIRQLAGPEQSKLILLAAHGRRGDAVRCGSVAVSKDICANRLNGWLFGKVSRK